MDLSMEHSAYMAQPSSKASEYRRVIKPLLERRRRARINHCLAELKNIILETSQQTECETSKLEKADILELTVKHLKHMRQVSPVPPMTPDSAACIEDRFRFGFAECAREVISYVSTNEVDDKIKQRLMGHLLSRFQTMASSVAPSSPTPPPSPVTRFPVSPLPYGTELPHKEMGTVVNGQFIVFRPNPSSPAHQSLPISQPSSPVPQDMFKHQLDDINSKTRPWRPW